MKKPNSAKPSKQRKWNALAPLHKKRKMISSSLSKELRAKYNRRSLTPRKGDTVELTRGQHKGTSAEVSKVNTKKGKVYITGVTIKKADGTEVEKPIDPSNLIIKELYMEDRKRRDILERTMKEK